MQLTRQVPGQLDVLLDPRMATSGIAVVYQLERFNLRLDQALPAILIVRIVRMWSSQTSQGIYQNGPSDMWL